MSSLLRRSFIMRAIPPPLFLAMPAVALDVSDKAIRFLELTSAATGYQVGMFGEVKIPPDVIEDGFIKNTDKLTAILENLRKEHKLSFVNVSLPGEKAYLFRTTIPHMEREEIRSALQFKIEENVPIALADAVFDYEVADSEDPSSLTIDASVTVIHTKVISSYLNAFTSAGLTPREFKTEVQAIAHAVIAPHDSGSYIIVAVRETKIVLVIVSRGSVYFSSTLSAGAQSITDSIKKQFAVGDEEAKKIGAGKEVRDRNELFMSLVNAASILRDEVQKLFAYWDDHPEISRGEKIKRIILTGSASLSGLDNYLAGAFPVEVKIADAWENVLALNAYIPPITREESLDYIPAIGLALPYDL